MLLLEKLRKVAFWTMDGVKGGKIRKNLDLLKQIEGSEVTDFQLSTYYENNLTELLNHCIVTVPAYANRPKVTDGLKDLQKWPVINKADLKSGGERYMSTSFDKEKLIPMSTSGSTGTPFTCWQNVDKKKHVNAEVLFYNGKIGYEIGRQIIYFRSIVNEVKKSRLQQWFQNIRLIDCCNLSDDIVKRD